MTNDEKRLASDERRRPTCPGCGTTMADGRRCKVRCERCGYFEDCNQGDVNRLTADG